MAAPRDPLAAGVSFRPLERSDFPLISRWLGAPHVAPWWMEPTDLTSVEATYGASIDGDDPTEVFIIARGHRSIGLIQRYRVRDNPAWERALGMERAAGIDYLIGEQDCLGLGLGARAITEFTEGVFAAYPDVSTVVAVPQQANTASWRALERAGFVRVRAGMIDSDDPADAGPAFVYSRRREAGRADEAPVT